MRMLSREMYYIWFPFLKKKKINRIRSIQFGQSEKKKRKGEEKDKPAKI